MTGSVDRPPPAGGNSSSAATTTAAAAVADYSASVKTAAGGLQVNGIAPSSANIESLPARSVGSGTALAVGPASIVFVVQEGLASGACGGSSGGGE